ncbi:MAG: ATP-binding cassette domain-containing protein [Alphaproteobacteria bacterium]|nr:ATP-binding cassette domain-containing protein [Alphaproteobacteria bacterium]
MFLALFNRERLYQDWLRKNQPENLPNRVFPLLVHFSKIMPVKFWGMVLINSLGVLCIAAIPYELKTITNNIISTGGQIPADFWHSDLGKSFIEFCFIVCGSYMFFWVVWLFSFTLRNPLMGRILQEIYSYVLKHDPTYFDNQLSGRVIQKSVDLCNQSMWMFEQFWWTYTNNFIYFTAAIAFLSFANPLLGIGLVAWLLVYFSLVGFMGYKIIPYSAAMSDARALVTGRYADVITNIRNMFLFASRTPEEGRLANAINNRINKGQTVYLATLNARVPMHVLSILGFIGFYGGCILAISHGLITVGDFAMVGTLTAVIMTRANDVANNLPELFENIGSAQESIDMLFTPHRLQDREGAIPLEIKQGSINFKNVNFAYDNRIPVFHNFNLHIKPGERIGLVGPSGSGKSTLVSLLLRLYDIESGEIAVDGQNISHASQESLRRQISMIPQESVLFHRSLADNIRYGRESASDEEVIAAAKAAEAHEFIEALPLDYKTLVGERGVKLSGGQRQRIAIARALLKNAPILVLDEATSALDSESEVHIQRAIRNAMEGKTVIAIAHRLSTIAHLDRLIVMSKGKIVEDGSHTELLEKGGLYAQLWAHQSGGFLQEH